MSNVEDIVNNWISNDSKGVAHFAWNDASEAEITTACGKIILLKNAKLTGNTSNEIPKCKRCLKTIPSLGDKNQ